MESTRLPRFKRDARAGPIQLTERDHEMLKFVHRHRFLRSSHIAALIGAPPQPILRRLQLLFHHGFLERPPAQIDYYHRGGSRQMVYGLGTKGAQVLKRGGGLGLPGFHSRESNRRVGRLFLEHALMTSDVMVAVELACRRAGGIGLLTGRELLSPGGSIPPREQFRWSVRLANRLKLGVIPDRVFGLEFPDRPAGRNRAFYFLEADCGTMPVTREGLSQSSFYRKLLAYEATWSQGLHRSKFGFPRFRVLTVTTSAERAKNLATAAGRLERGHGLFLFTDIGFLRNGSDFLTVPWMAPGAGQTAHLLTE